MSSSTNHAVAADESLGRDPGTGVYRANYESDEPTSTAVVMHTATASGVDPIDLPPLAEAIDPDAIDSLFPDETLVGRLTFMYAGCELTLRSDGHIRIVP